MTSLVEQMQFVERIMCATCGEVLLLHYCDSSGAECNIKIGTARGKFVPWALTSFQAEAVDFVLNDPNLRGIYLGQWVDCLNYIFRTRRKVCDDYD